MKQLPLFDSYIGLIILAVYGIIVFSLTSYFGRGYNKTKTAFLLSNRDLTQNQGSMSVAAAWLWAAGLFISTQQAYVNGMVGLFWFCFGAILTYWLFGWFAQQLRNKFSNGFTFSSYMEENYGKKVQNIYVFEMILLAICVFALNILAGGKIIELLTGLSYYITIPIMTSIALLYAFRGGLKASVITEIFKIGMVWIGVLIILPMIIYAVGGFDIVVKGMSGIDGRGLHIFGTDKAWQVFTGFGIAAFLGQMGAFFGDNAFYQRAFAVPKEKVFKTFAIGSLIYGIIPISMGLIGFAAVGYGLEIPKAQVGMTNAIMIANLLPAWVSVFFVFVVFAGLVSVLDSQFSSIASMAGHDLVKKFKAGSTDEDVIKYARIGMIGLALAGMAIAFIPGITLLHIFLFFGTLRASVWIPSMVAIIKPKLFTSNGLFYGILVSISVGIPMFTYGKLINNNDIALIGTVIAIFGSFIISYICSQTKK
jgi:urea-proton symporter